MTESRGPRGADTEEGALREEARHWMREAKRARAQRDAARKRADGIARPVVEVVQGETYWRVVVNGTLIDGYEDESVAQAIVRNLRKAFEVR